jgi:hypothetical protein
MVSIYATFLLGNKRLNCAPPPFKEKKCTATMQRNFGSCQRSEHDGSYYQTSQPSAPHYGTQTRCRQPVAVGTAKNAVGTVCADGHRRHIAVDIGGRRHRPYCCQHRFSRRHSYRPTAMMSRRHRKFQQFFLKK